MIAEDDKLISRAYEMGLSDAGYRVVIALDGSQALEKMQKEKPDLIMLDLIMPNKNGFEVLQEVKRTQALAHIPVIILSNLGQDADVKRGMDLGASDYFIKANWSMKEVIEKIEALLGKS